MSRVEIPASAYLITATYADALRVAEGLLDGVDENASQATREYARGVIEVIAQVFPQPGEFTEPGKARIAAELGIDPGMVR